MGNVVLIGMPGVGKSTIGRLLAQALRKQFIDTDALIQRQEGRSLQQIIDRDGLDAFLKIEERMIVDIEIDGHVVATGGSVVYSQKAVAALKKNGIVIYLTLPYREIEARLGETTDRGIAMGKGQSLSQLYQERVPLYEKCADATVDCSGKDAETVVAAIIAVLKR